MADINDLIRKAQTTNSKEAYCKLGDAYAFGRGVPKNMAQAIACWEKASELRSAYAKSQLGSCYYNGNGVPQNYSKAKALFQEAADLGDVHAIFQLGMMCYQGNYSFWASKGKAFTFWKKAAEQGHPQAQYMIAASYTSDDWGAEKDYRKAAYWYMCAYQNRQSDQHIIDRAKQMLNKLSSLYDLDDIKDEIIRKHPEYLNLN